MTFDEVVAQAQRAEPHDYQQRLADEGLPDVLAVPTGCGKTLAATLPWLYRRVLHPEPDVRGRTPHWLVLTLPMRVLVEQTHQVVAAWLDRLGLKQRVGPFRVMGGEGRRDAEWRYHPERDAIFVGTLDMLLSRALNRGYGESRWAWPIDFGLFNAGSQWVFDEVQLMGPGLPTSRQVQALRGLLGMAAECRSMWMSATVDPSQLQTVDSPDVGTVVELSPADRQGPLRAVLEAGKMLRRVDLPGRKYISELAEVVKAEHCSGSRTIVVANTVDRAAEVYDAVGRMASEVPRVLVHSRFRPADRQRAVDLATADVPPDGPGLVVVTTQVLEAGVDISSRRLITELAPWPSMVQRAGRCNRYGADPDAAVLWVRPPRALPYEEAELESAADGLVALEASSVSPDVLSRRQVPTKDPRHPVLRRHDLVELFDTLPDLSGNDVDVSRFIRDVDGTDVYVAWRELGGKAPGARDPLPSRDERCPVPLSQLQDRKARVGERNAWRYDHVIERWVRCGREDLRPGQVLVFDAAQGGYDPERGWSPSSTAPVEDLRLGDMGLAGTEEDTALGGDPVSYTKQWVSLTRHLGDVEVEVRRLTAVLPSSLPATLLDAAVYAGRYHDIGKAHDVFQDTLERSATTDEERDKGALEPRPWAKSGGGGRPFHERRHFRHELASALVLLSPDCDVLRDVAEPDLVVYLVAAHHGRVRLGFRSLPGESSPADDPTRLFALGVWDGDRLPAIELPGGGELPATRLDLSSMRFGRAGDGSPSWAERALNLRDRDDLGPFRLGFLEAIVRVADWKVSAGYDREVGNDA